jgi:hypothetical protein
MFDGWMQPMNTLRKIAMLSVATSLVLAPGCKRDEITQAVTAKGASEPAPSGMAGAMPMPMPGPGTPPGMAGEVPPPPTPTGAEALKWTLPTGWTESRPGGMRYATLKPSADSKLEASVVVLPGPAGGELPNVNRWRGQIGLPPIDAAALATARQSVKTKAGDISLYDFTGEGEQKSRMIAGLLTTDGSTWFVKMVGDAEPVGAVRPDFIHLLETFHFDR